MHNVIFGLWDDGHDEVELVDMKQGLILTNSTHRQQVFEWHCG